MFLTKDNDGVTINANGNYSGTPARFILKASDRDLKVTGLIVQIEDSDAFLNTYGALTALTNGIKFRIEREPTPGNFELIRTLLGGQAFKKTMDWPLVGGIVTPFQQDFLTKGTQVQLDFGEPFTLSPGPGHPGILVAYLADNLTGLDNHTFYAVLEA